MTPEAYIAAVKTCPRVAWVDGSGHLQYGYAVAIHYAEIAGRVVRHDQAYGSDGRTYGLMPNATGFDVDLRGKFLFDPSYSQPLSVLVSVVPDSTLSATGTLRWIFSFVFDYGSAADLRRRAKWSTDDRLCGSNEVWIEKVFLKRIPSKAELHAHFISKHGKAQRAYRMEYEAAKELIYEQHKAVRQQAAEQRARQLWARYYSMFDERHISEMSGAEFERFTGKLYTRLGYSVSFTQGGADQGVDLIVCKDGHRIAVQAKRWTGVVGNKAVQEVIAGKLYYGCSHAWIVTSSTFSSNAVALAAKDPTILLVDGHALSKLCEQFRTHIPAFSLDEWEKIKDVAERFA